MFTKTGCIIRITAAFLLLILCLALCGGLGSFAEDKDESFVPEGAIPIDEYILVSMEHEYSFPDEDHPPAYFDAEYVKEVKAIFWYQDGSLADADHFMRIEKLYLTDEGKAHIDELIEALNARDDIACAERDYLCPNVSADGPEESVVPAAAKLERTRTPEDIRYNLDFADGAAYLYSPEYARSLTGGEFAAAYRFDGCLSIYAADGTQREKSEDLMNGDILRAEYRTGEELFSAPIVFQLDPNGDGVVTSADAREALRIAAKTSEPDRSMLLAADADGSGKVDSSDARLLLRVAARLVKRAAATADFTNKRLMDKIVMTGIYTDEPKELETVSAVLEELEKEGLSAADRERLEKSFRRVNLSMICTPYAGEDNDPEDPVAAEPGRNFTIVILQLDFDARKDIEQIMELMDRNSRVIWTERDGAGYIDD